jgi:hypothetical protein
MRIQVCFVLIGIFLFSCKTNFELKTAIYTSSKPNLTQRLKYKFDVYAKGSKLQLKDNNSFTMHTCGNNIAGNWKQVEDTLYLTPTSNDWADDSLKIYGFNGEQPTISGEPISYFIRNKYLIHLDSFELNDEIKKSIEVLKYISK